MSNTQRKIREEEMAGRKDRKPWAFRGRGKDMEKNLYRWGI